MSGRASTRPLVLIICDGWGHNADAYGNAIAAARTPRLDRLNGRWPHTLLAASGEAVGLPAGQQGNSEVGHLTIGAGRIVMQDLPRITRAIETGSFFENSALCTAVDRARDRGAALHCLGLVSPGGVHSHMAHGLALTELARRRGLDRVWFHAFTDGRDEPPASAAGFMREFVRGLERAGTGRVASVSGRYYAMDRDRRWDRTRQAYEVVVAGTGPLAPDPVACIERGYEEGLTDEFLAPSRVASGGAPPPRIESGDSVVFFNFRPDRARQLSHAILDEDFASFPRSWHPRDLDFVTFTEYEAGLGAQVAFPKEDVRETLAEVVSRAGLRQFHVAETEKYAHVTYFVNGGREVPFDGEERLLVPSPKVATYDTLPEMSADAIAAAVIDRVSHDADALVVVNFANADMVGHTGDLEATVRAVETVDACIGRIADAVLGRDGVLVITADHGNAELELDRRDGSMLTAHTTSPVPLLVCGTPARALSDGGGLQDIAPTVLSVMGLPKPAVMTGRSLLG